MVIDHLRGSYHIEKVGIVTADTRKRNSIPISVQLGEEAVRVRRRVMRKCLPIMGKESRSK